MAHEKVAWLSQHRIHMIAGAHPELRGRIALDSTGDGCYTANAVSKLRAAGENRLADLLLRAVADELAPRCPECGTFIEPGTPRVMVRRQAMHPECAAEVR